MKTILHRGFVSIYFVGVWFLFTGGYFESPRRDWQGLSAGITVGAPVGFGLTTTDYVPIW